MTEVVVIGNGPAGCTAAMYLAKAGAKVTVISGKVPGGQIVKARDVTNYPGFESIDGFRLMELFINQYEKLGIETIHDEVHYMDSTSVELTDKVLHPDYTIVAVGSRAKLLGLSNESELLGDRIHTCVSCDGGFYKDQDIAVVGDGELAVKDAIYLSSIGNKVYLIGSGSLQVGEKLIEDLMDRSNIELLNYHSITSYKGLLSTEDQYLDLFNNILEEPRKIRVSGVFLVMGSTPDASQFSNLELDDKGYIKVNDDYCTSIPNVYACGDCTNKLRFHQVVTAAASGAEVAMIMKKNGLIKV